MTSRPASASPRCRGTQIDSVNGFLAVVRSPYLAFTYPGASASSPSSPPGLADERLKLLPSLKALNLTPSALSITSDSQVPVNTPGHLGRTAVAQQQA